MASITQRFGSQVRKIRKQKNISQHQLALKAGLDLTSINEIENGSRSPMLKTIWKIANALGVSLKELFSF